MMSNRMICCNIKEMNMADSKQLRTWGKQVIDIEKSALDDLYQYVDSDAFVAVCDLILECKGKVVVMGMGKSGHIGNKIAATLASTGTPAIFVHPGEASHGDLGVLSDNDVVIAISNSGESSEILTLFPVIKRLGLPLISMTGKPKSTMANNALLHLCIGMPAEACPLGLAPTSSTTVTLVMGDALAVALLQARGFTADDFALSHPGGSLGRKLLLKVEDVMHKGEQLPLVHQDTVITEALYEISRKSLGMAAIVGNSKKLLGVFTDGDLRRVIDAKVDLASAKISEVMTANCITVHQNMLAAEALNIMEQKNINGLIVVDDAQCPVGALNMLDMVKSGVI